MRWSGLIRRWGSETFRLVSGILAGGMFTLLALPLLALAITSSPADLWAGFRHPLAKPALWLSLQTTLLSVVIIVVTGTPLAWWLGQSQSGDRSLRPVDQSWLRSGLPRWVASFVQLPMVIPPAVAGIALLLTFGRHGLLGGALLAMGLSVSFSTAAVVLAQVFVAAPFYLQSAVSAFARLDVHVLAVARTLGASPARVFLRVALPLARRELTSGAAMAWARALGEFGATLMFAGSLAGRTQTLPLAIYAALESDLRAARSLSLLLVLVGFVLLAALRGRALGREAPR